MAASWRAKSVLSLSFAVVIYIYIQLCIFSFTNASSASPLIGSANLRLESSRFAKPPVQNVAYKGEMKEKWAVQSSDRLSVSIQWSTGTMGKKIRDDHYNMAVLFVSPVRPLSSTTSSPEAASSSLWRDVYVNGEWNSEERPSFADWNVSSTLDLTIWLFSHPAKTGASPIQWHLGQLQLEIGDMDQEAVEPGPHDNCLYPLPERTPTFEIKTVPRSNLFTWIFLILILVPWVVLFTVWKRVGVNVQLLHANFFLSCLFQGLVISLFLTLAATWAYLDMFSSLHRLAVLSLLTAVVGSLHFRSLSKYRQSVLVEPREHTKQE